MEITIKFNELGVGSFSISIEDGLAEEDRSLSIDNDTIIVESVFFEEYGIETVIKSAVDLLSANAYKVAGYLAETYVLDAEGQLDGDDTITTVE